MINPIKSLTLVTLGSITVAKYLVKNLCNSTPSLLLCFQFSSASMAIAGKEEILVQQYFLTADTKNFCRELSNGQS
jgi:hypothetical protein